MTSELELSKMYVEYKFVIRNGKGEYIWEEGMNRKATQKKQVINTMFRYPHHPEPRFAGINVPVFSINTKSNYGCGEFADLRLMADFCVKAGLKVI